jgi:hypothetical protein
MFNPKNQSVMKFTTLKVVNHHDEVEKALTISQIKELLEYVAETKREMRKSFESSLEDCDECSEEYDDYKHMSVVYRYEEQALRQLAVCLDDYIA